MKNSQGLPVGI